MKQGDWLSFGGWGLAGVPVFATFLQALFALGGIEARTVPLVGGVVQTLISMPLFKAAAVQFKSSTGVVLVLFVLIALAWLGQGIAMGPLRNRDATFACAGLVSVLFLALFFGVYAPLLSADVGTVGLVAFVATPFVAAASALGAAWTRDWDVDLEAETATELSRAEDALAAKRDAFEAAFDDRLGEDALETLSEFAPRAVEDARTAAEDERAVYEELSAELSSVRSADVDASVRRERAIELRERVENHDPERAVDRIESDLTAAVMDVVDRGEVAITVRSRYGGTYDLSNLPRTFRELELQPGGSPSHVDDLGHAIGSLAERSDATLDVVASALSTVEVHRDRIERHVSDAEESFHETLSAAEADVDRVEAELERLEGAVRERVEALLVEGRDDDISSVHAVESTLREARDALHACQFDEAERQVGEARETADRLLTTVQFLGSVEGALGHGQERLTLPTEVPSRVAEEVEPAFEREYGIDYRVSDGAIAVDARRDESATTTPGSRHDAGRGSTSSASSATSVSDDSPGSSGSRGYVDMEAVVDEVLLLLDELRDAAGAGSTTVHLETGELPSYVATEDALDALETFASRNTDLVASVDVPAGPPGIIDVRFADGAHGEAALGTLQERFKSEYA